MHAQVCNLQQNILFLQPMKFVFVFLAIFLLYLSCLPCGDRGEYNVKNLAKISESTNHHGHKHSSDACTPFCNCSCCAASAFHSPLLKVQTDKVYFQSVKFPLHNEDCNTEVFYSIWQPPKLAA
ncbi:DUF6660 family protein [Hydrotalea sp.]|uniref:DUF6660 family protein n=2 Tax=Hydrotalea sp. TaxID=2881279 RepID=UPI003423288C